MKLTDMKTQTNCRKMNKIFESRFGFTVNFDTMSIVRAQKLTKSLTEAIAKFRNSTALHTAEKNPRYTELILVRESLMSWMKEKRHVMERKLSGRKLMEGEVGQAEALLAAKDIVDSVQDMLEKAGKIQNEQLPALLDTIRDQIGSEEADAFKASMSQMFTTLSGQLGTARDQADTSVRALTGDISVDTGDVAPSDEPSDVPPIPDVDQDLEHEDVPQKPMHRHNPGRGTR